MEYKVETLIFDHGERYPILMGSDGMPHFYTTLWVTTKLRSSMAVNTMVNRLGALKWLFKWEEDQERDFYSEFQKGQFLSDKDIENIKSHLAMDVARIKGISKKKNIRNKVVSIDDAISGIEITPTVGRNHHYNRMTSVAEYLDFIAKVAVQSQNNEKLTRSIKSMTKRFKAHRPKGKGKNVIDNHDGKTLTDGLVKEFLEVAHYDSPLNPFKHEVTKRRNHLMFLLLKELGLRRGELLSLTINNGHMRLVGDKPYIWVRREHDSEFDPRKAQPVAKTKERMLRIKKDVAILIDEYICKYRFNTPNANKHPFLFVTHHKCTTQGQPISVSTFDTVIIPMMKRVDPKFDDIYAHYFRHDWNEVFSKKVDAINELADAGSTEHKRIEPEKESKMRQHSLGHSSEKSHAVYNRRHVKKRANEVALEEQEELERKVKELKNKEGNGS
ncbi:tyrosine-type recombinase/integrase [Vibrio sp. 10N.247.311.14]|uniref:site-specific integrase n=1 Tax=unclassified Vibrio TaxID=2614977 RepID=UPI000CAB2CF6|nr:MULTISPECIES: site-specific integrase [unclassified Vibrio]PMK18014.1 hypothetical protein BCU05_18315 [Vibrio sp. 10N.261.54.C3]TKF43870.1 site-specific integrase [Vibrio sp. F13]TKF62462.1 site-specific integrase [Vibrio sp. F13]